jgi:UDP-glucuronate decarboxylase
LSAVPTRAPQASALRFPQAVRDRLRRGDVRVLVTGAGGWLGRATLEMLDDALGAEMPERVCAYAAQGRHVRLRSGRTLALAPLTELAHVPRDPRPTLVAHYAFLTREKAAAMPTAAYVAANRWITDFVTGQAARLGARATFSTSSGAVYDRAGELHPSLDHNPYGALKGEEEEAFADLGRQTGSRVVVARVFNLSGPFLNKEYALGSLVGDVLAGRTVQIRAPHRVVRSYAHVGEVVAVGVAAMLGIVAAPTEPFDTAGDEEVEVGDLALRVRAALHRPDLAIVRPPLAGGAEDRYVGDGTLYRALAAQAGAAYGSLDHGIRDTAAHLAAVAAEPSQGRSAEAST